MRVRSSAGELSIFEASERDAVERIVGAIQEALYLRASENQLTAAGELYSIPASTDLAFGQLQETH